MKKTLLIITTFILLSNNTLQASENNKNAQTFISQQPTMPDHLKNESFIFTAEKPLTPALKCLSLGCLVFAAGTYNQEPFTKTCCLLGGLGCVVLGSSEYGTIRESRDACDSLGLKYKKEK